VAGLYFIRDLPLGSHSLFIQYVHNLIPRTKLSPTSLVLVTMTINACKHFSCPLNLALFFFFCEIALPTTLTPQHWLNH